MTDFEKTLALHMCSYPKMEPVDYIKLAFQHSFGVGHLLTDPLLASDGIRREMREMRSPSCPKEAESVGSGMVRYPLSLIENGTEAEVLAKAMMLTAQGFSGSQETLSDALHSLEALGDPNIARSVSEWLSAGGGAVHHSESFRREYGPHYRLIKAEFAPFLKPAAKLLDLASKRPVCIAVDGRCGSGKTSFSDFMSKLSDCNVMHMDDFYLPMSERSPDWRKVPAGNMDFMRLKTEMLDPLRAGREFEYRPYLCASGRLSEPVPMKPKRLNIVEGSYSHHPDIAEYFDFKVFITVSQDEQKRRLSEREGEYFPEFLRTWIPCEENYFAAFSVQDGCDLLITT